jgi:hypothetical protein
MCSSPTWITEPNSALNRRPAWTVPWCKVPAQTWQG